MRTKVIKHAAVSITVCDLCDSKQPVNETCWVCGRDCCYKCRKMFFCGKSSDLVEMAIKVCSRCQQPPHDQLIEKVQGILDGANKQLREWVDLWRRAAKKERKESNAVR